MAEQQIKFEDGASYERMMGTWSRIAGEIFLDWVQPRPGLRWIDVGCGNGAFTQLIVDRCAPAEVHGVDPAPAQLEYAQQRPASRVAQFQAGDAQALPFSDQSFDAAAMALVIFFVPDPVKGVAEMVRVCKPGGIVCAYAWDILGGGFPLAPLQQEMRAIGVAPTLPPSVDASRIDAMLGMWGDAGLVDIETRPISVQRTFASFDDFWEVSLAGSSIGPKVRAMSPADVQTLRSRVRDRVAPDAQGRVTLGARANAVKGCLPR